MSTIPFLNQNAADGTPKAPATSDIPRTLIVSSSADFRAQLRTKLSPSRWHVEEAESGSDALGKLSDIDCQVLILEPALPDLTVADFRELLNTMYPHLQVVTVNPRTGLPIQASTAPLGIEIVELIHKHGPVCQFPVPESAPAETKNNGGLPGLIGDSPQMQKVYSLARMVAPRSTTVLITGESGTGKDLFAQAIHSLSPRHANPFVVINCAAIPEPLLEAELFGYVKGAFTGAVQSRVGRIHAAHKGTLFLDEIGDMPLALQSKMLRFLEQGEVQRLGSTENFRVDVRVVAATNAHLTELVKQKMFREDLYYRLAVFPIGLPRLRERLSDVPVLASAFLTSFSLRRSSLSSAAIDTLMQHSWPGNVRELRNVMERASILLGDDTVVAPEHIVI